LNYENVKLWFAKNNERVVTIDEVNEENKNNTYMCPVCGSDLKPKAISSKRVTPHFAHMDSSKCNSESQIHFWFKHKFLEKGDKFTVAADKARDYICKEIIVEKEYTVGDYTYRPDVTVLTECGEIIYFEMAFSNKKKVKDYLDIWLELKNVVVEVDIKDLVLKNEIPKFNSLFYEGKCFNTKRNDTYYNTIGKYKEKSLFENSGKDTKEQLQKLDWLWNDLIKYKNNEIESQQIFDLIEIISPKERIIVRDILTKQKCSNLYNEYLSYKVNKVHGEVTRHLNRFYPLDYYKLSNTHGGVILESPLGRARTFYSIEERSCEQLISELKNDIENKTLSIKKAMVLDFAKLNDSLRLEIEKIEKKLKSLDNNYNFYDRFVYDKFVSLCYGSHNLLDIKLPDSLIYSKDGSKIYNYMMEKINYYFNSMTPFKNLPIIENKLNKVINKYANKIITKELVSKTIKIGKRRYKDVKEIKNAVIDVSYKLIAQDTVRIDVKYNFVNNFMSDCIYIYKDNLYIQFGDYKLYENIKSGESPPIRCIDEFENLAEYIGEIINTRIKKELENNCSDCNSSIDMSVGEIDFFISKELQLPKRCVSCRKKRKHN
jgi:hypothetical protein